VNRMTEISRLDRAIKAIHRELRRLEKITTLSAESWQAAWDKHPDLRARENELYRRRGIAQQQNQERRRWSR
jgi:predicted transcriptional regulator